ncbi:hypothetical protein RDWZM_002285 [Blomia tropicalis]|uniref:DUF4230 domain-containing protein n=1 Tax=Blomia tropicalis TaxID=40697 RepID=A0A9Q0MD89_BLOTA|nr:hypothetical protein BLOT_002013 [Blomia tropicalis]KAJ6223740.1 hypothetical protein RDWZM_002285 [Blomia tropicalis]
MGKFIAFIAIIAFTSHGVYGMNLNEPLKQATQRIEAYFAKMSSEFNVPGFVSTPPNRFINEIKFDQANFKNLNQIKRSKPYVLTTHQTIDCYFNASTSTIDSAVTFGDLKGLRVIQQVPVSVYFEIFTPNFYAKDKSPFKNIRVKLDFNRNAIIYDDNLKQEMDKKPLCELEKHIIDQSVKRHSSVHSKVEKVVEKEVLNALNQIHFDDLWKK